MQQENMLVLIDGSSLAFRSFFALFNSGLRTKNGLPTWAILGFFNSLFELIEKFQPPMLAVCFDMAEPTFRHIEFKEYKANRLEMPDDLSSQWPLIKEGVEKLGLPVYEMPGYEADDLIGTIAREAEKRKLDVLILTGDQDAFQLIDGEKQQIKVLMPGKTGLQLFGRQEVFNKLGVWPEQIIDYKGLCGDSSDNIPGIKGIGPKTAQQLLSTYGSIDGIYQNIDQIKAKGVHSKLVEGQDVARLSKGLATIRCDVPLSFDFAHCQLTPPNQEALADFFGQLEFKTMITRLPKILKNFSEIGESIAAPEDESIAAPEIVTKVVPKENILQDDPNLKIVSSEADLDWLIDNLSKQTIISLHVHALLNGTSSSDTTSTEEKKIFGYAFAWDKEISLESDWLSIANKAANTEETNPPFKQTAYVFLRPMGLALGGQPGLDRQLANNKLAKIFEATNIGKIVYNYKHVLNLLASENLSLNKVVFDSMLASYISSPDENHGLYEQARRLLNHATERLSPVRRSNQSAKTRSTAKLESASTSSALITLNLAQMAEQSCEDASINLQLAHYYAATMEPDQKFLLQEMELPLAAVLAKMEQTGVALDLPYLQTFAKELNSDLAKLEHQIFTLAGHPFNINSTQQLQKILFEELGLTTKTKTKTGFSTDASVLESLKHEHEIIPSLLDYRQLTKLKSTYVDALPKMVSNVDKRLHGEFNQTVTSTGRLSSSNPNLQNIPIRTELGRRMRRAFVPGDRRWFLLSADYSQIELRLLAHMSEDERLIDAFKKNQDIHARTASEIFDTSIEGVTLICAGLVRHLILL